MKTIKEIIDYIPGRGCECSAYNSYECGCDVDWTPTLQLELQWKIGFLKNILNLNNLLTKEIQEVVDEPFEVYDNTNYIINPSLEKYKHTPF